jgi:hypothetical protein
MRESNMKMMMHNGRARRVSLAMLAVLGLWLGADVSRAALVTVSGSETWDGVANPHATDGVTLSQAGGVSTYTIPNGMTIGASGVIGLGTANSNVTLSFAPGGGGLILDGQINVSSGFRNGAGTGPVRTFTLAMNNNSITGTGDIVCTYTTGATQDKHDLSITGTGNVSFDDIDFRHSDGGAGGTVNIAIGGTVTLDTINTSDDHNGGGAAEDVTVRGSAVTVGAISAFSARTGSAANNGNVTIEALLYPGFDPDDDTANSMANTVTLGGAIDVEGSTSVDQGGGNVTIRGVVVTLNTAFTVDKEADATLGIYAGVEPPFAGFHFSDSSSDDAGYTATYNVAYALPPLRESQTFDSAAAAALNGWVAVDGDGPSNSDGGTDLQAGWSNTELAGSELAGDQSGEGRVRGSRGNNVNMTYYADTTLGRDYFTFADKFVASGRMDFGALSESDYIGSGFVLGFFDRRATQTNAAIANLNYTSVGFDFNQELTALAYMRIRRIDAAGNMTMLSAAPNLGISVGNDLLFSFDYDPAAGANGQGQLSGTITDADTLAVTSFSIDLTEANRTALAGGVLNSFGLVKPRANFPPNVGYADWYIDDVTYGDPAPPAGTVITIR